MEEDEEQPIIDEACNALCAETERICKENGVTVEEFSEALIKSCRPSWHRRIWSWVRSMGKGKRNEQDAK